MPTRDELKILIDQLPEPRLEIVRQMLERHIRPLSPGPQIGKRARPSVGEGITLEDFEHMKQQGQTYRERVLQRFSETRKPGTISGGIGLGGEHKAMPFGLHGFHYWDDKALVEQSLQNFEGQQVEIMRRLAFSADRTKLTCSMEITSGGQTVRHEDQFPVAKVGS